MIEKAKITYNQVIRELKLNSNATTTDDFKENQFNVAKVIQSKSIQCSNGNPKSEGQSSYLG